MSDEAQSNAESPATDDEPSAPPTALPADTDRDVVVVGGGPAGTAAAVFTARYGLDTLVFDRGNAALRRCAYLENYPGFPGGVDVDVFHDLLHAHLEAVGTERVPELVERVEYRADGPGFVVETDEGRSVTTGTVVAAAWYDGRYLRPLEREGEGDEDESDGDDDPAMFETHEHHGELEERFDPEYADADGRTPIDGLYVASPAGLRSGQAVIAAGNGAHVARSLIEDDRRAVGYAGDLAPEYDWLRQDAEFSGEWAERDRWREWAEKQLPDEPDDDHADHETLRETAVERAFATRRTDDEVAAAWDDGIEVLVDAIGAERIVDAVGEERIVDAVGEERIVDAVGEERLLEAMDEGTLRDHLDGTDGA